MPMLAGTSVEDYFILDESLPFILTLQSWQPKFGIRFEMGAAAAIKIIQQVNPSPSWIWMDTFEAQLPVDREELKDLVAVGAKVCLVSPELHPDHEAKFPTDAFMKSVDTVGIENFHAVCTKQPTFWSDFRK